MTWAKIDDNFCDHPKVVQAGPVAIGLWTCALSYCAKYLTDGFIPANQVKRILIDLDDPMQVAEKLVSVGLWERSESGYTFHDYLVYNPSKEQVLKDRQETKERIEAWREKKKQEPCNGVGNTVTDDVTNTSPDPDPDPDPDPVPQKPSCANAQKREPTAREITLTRLENVFSQNTGLPLPPRTTVAEKKASAKRWWNPLWAIYDVSSGADIERAEKLIMQTISKMRNDNLTIVAPQSIQQVAASIAANGNGALPAPQKPPSKVHR